MLIGSGAVLALASFSSLLLTDGGADHMVLVSSASTCSRCLPLPKQRYLASAALGVGLTWGRHFMALHARYVKTAQIFSVAFCSSTIQIASDVTQVLTILACIVH